MPHPQRKKSEEKLLIDLACGASVEAAARKNDVSERTVYRRLADPVFARQVQEVRGEMLQRAAGMLTAASMEAVKTLLTLQSQQAPAAVQLGSARSILEIGLKVRELAEIEQRLDELERRSMASGRGMHSEDKACRSANAFSRQAFLRRRAGVSWLIESTQTQFFLGLRNRHRRLELV